MCCRYLYARVCYHFLAPGEAFFNDLADHHAKQAVLKDNYTLFCQLEKHSSKIQIFCKQTVALMSFITQAAEVVLAKQAEDRASKPVVLNELDLKAHCFSTAGCRHRMPIYKYLGRYVCSFSMGNNHGHGNCCGLKAQVLEMSVFWNFTLTLCLRLKQGRPGTSKTSNNGIRTFRTGIWMMFLSEQITLKIEVWPPSRPLGYGCSTGFQKMHRGCFGMYRRRNQRTRWRILAIPCG